MTSHPEDPGLESLVREALPPVREIAAPPGLWSRIEPRLGEPRRRVTRLDWFLAAAVVGLLVGFPDALLLLLYHL